MTLCMWKKILHWTLTSPTITSVTTGSLGVLHNDPFPTQLLAIQVIHGIVCITGVIKFNKPVPFSKEENRF